MNNEAVMFQLFIYYLYSITCSVSVIREVKLTAYLSLDFLGGIQPALQGAGEV